MKLTLENGDVFVGTAFGHPLRDDEFVLAELVFCTGQSGYEEVLTDPSYFRQIVLMTFPLIGNTGINHHDAESAHAYLSGLVVREVEEVPSHYRSQLSLPEYLREQRVPGLAGLDTRALTQRLRTHGTLRAALSGDQVTHDQLMAALSQPLLRDHVAQVSTKVRQQHPSQGPNVAVIDYGCKRGIVRALLDRGCAVTVFPHDVTAPDVLACQPDGVVLSNGPGDPSALAADVSAVLPTIRALQETAPLLGICLGHQLFALANGAATEKLHHGHRGCNRSVFDSETGQAAIAAHNHGYAVTADSLAGSELRVTFRDLNDGCIEGLRHTRLPAWSVQFHPEAGPGPQDPRFLFDEFVRTLVSRRAALESTCR